MLKRIEKFPEVHRYCLESRNQVENTIGESGTSTTFLDIGTEVMNFKIPMGGVIW